MAKINNVLFRKAKKYLVGGVNSPVRSFRQIGRDPIFIKRARGSRIYSEDEREFIDYCQSWGALILGHSHPEVVTRLKKVINNGTSFGAVTKLEIELAQLITQRIPSIEKIRFTNSGTEAVMGAIRLARAYTNRNKLIKFRGSYHGQADYLLDSIGVPEDFTKHTIVSDYNDIEKTRALVEKYKKDIAAIIVEPIAANMGVVLPQQGFLEGLRSITKKYNIVLVFDEVITGFRLTFGGVQSLFNIKPDLTCLGKIIGGGLPIGAFGGKREIMRLLSPEGPVYQAGTFSGNPMSMSAGLITLKILQDTHPYKRLEELTQKLCKGIKERQERRGYKIKINSMGSLFSIFFTEEDVIDYKRALTQRIDLFRKFYQGLLKEGIYLSPSGFETNFLSCAHTDNDIEKTISAVRRY
jgi:glutamate-1-semialdehyde 2,1-aminomutase